MTALLLSALILCGCSAETSAEKEPTTDEKIAVEIASATEAAIESGLSDAEEIKHKLEELREDMEIDEMSVHYGELTEREFGALRILVPDDARLDAEGKLAFELVRTQGGINVPIEVRISENESFDAGAFRYGYVYGEDSVGFGYTMRADNEAERYVYWEMTGNDPAVYSAVVDLLISGKSYRFDFTCSLFKANADDLNSRLAIYDGINDYIESVRYMKNAEFTPGTAVVYENSCTLGELTFEAPKDTELIRTEIGEDQYYAEEITADFNIGDIRYGLIASYYKGAGQTEKIGSYGLIKNGDGASVDYEMSYTFSSVINGNIRWSIMYYGEQSFRTADIYFSDGKGLYLFTVHGDVYEASDNEKNDRDFYDFVTVLANSFVL